MPGSILWNGMFWCGGVVCGEGHGQSAVFLLAHGALVSYHAIPYCITQYYTISHTFKPYHAL